MTVIYVDDIFYNNDNNENSEWYYVNVVYCDFENVLTLLCECNITHTQCSQPNYRLRGSHWTLA